jgi:hypothetical protein
LHGVGALPRREALPMTHIACGFAPNIAPTLCNAAHVRVRNPGWLRCAFARRFGVRATSQQRVSTATPTTLMNIQLSQDLLAKKLAIALC